MASLELVRGDITAVSVHAIVNAANSSLMGGGGVDGAIHRAGGPGILAECKVIAAERGPLPTGEAVSTTAGRLPARFVIHTVGPVWGQVDDETAVELLAACYRNSLDLARDLGCDSVAFPNISTGVYHFPKPLAADTAIASTTSWLEEDPGRITRVLFVCFDEENRRLYHDRLHRAA